MLYDILKDTRAFQKIASEGRQEGLQEGLQYGCENLRLAIIDMAEARFSEETLVEQVRVQVAKISDLETLRHLVVKIALLTTPAEVGPLLAQYEQPAAEQERTKLTRPRKKKAAE